MSGGCWEKEKPRRLRRGSGRGVKGGVRECQGAVLARRALALRRRALREMKPVASFWL